MFCDDFETVKNWKCIVDGFELVNKYFENVLDGVQLQLGWFPLR